MSYHRRLISDVSRSNNQWASFVEFDTSAIGLLYVSGGFALGPGAAAGRILQSIDSAGIAQWRTFADLATIPGTLGQVASVGAGGELVFTTIITSTTMSNVGSGTAEVFKQQVGNDFELRTLDDTATIAATQNTSTITLDFIGDTGDVPEGANLYYTEPRVSANADVAAATSHAADSTIHFIINDAGISTTETWSSSQTNSIASYHVDTETTAPFAATTSTTTANLLIDGTSVVVVEPGKYVAMFNGDGTGSRASPGAVYEYGIFKNGVAEAASERTMWVVAANDRASMITMTSLNGLVPGDVIAAYYQITCGLSSTLAIGGRCLRIVRVAS